MRKLILTTLCLFVVAGAAQATIIKYGYSNPAPSVYPSISQDYLLGFAISVPEQMDLTDVGIITYQMAPHVKVGIYSDSGGPATLLAQTNATNIPANTDTMIPVTNPVTLEAGTYWFMAVYEAGAFNRAPATSQFRQSMWLSTSTIRSRRPFPLIPLIMECQRATTWRASPNRQPLPCSALAPCYSENANHKLNCLLIQGCENLASISCSIQRLQPLSPYGPCGGHKYAYSQSN